ncbi:hypothetical protein [Staphylococcus phage PT1-4]
MHWLYIYKYNTWLNICQHSFYSPFKSVVLHNKR